MAKSQRRWLKWLLRVALAMVILFSCYVSLLAYPTPLFSDKVKYQNLTLYCDDNLDSTYVDILTDVSHRITASDLYQPDHNYHIYLCKSKKLYSMFATLAHRTTESQGFVLSLLNSIFISQTRINHMKSVSPGITTHSFLDGNVAEVISHEIGHQLIMQHTGLANHSKLPFWKIEGVCEYTGNSYTAALDSTSQLRDRVALLYNDYFWGGADTYQRRVYRASILVQYLAEVENLTAAQILDYPGSDREIETDLKAWYRLKIDKRL